ncbi:MAG TPA: hypothetical protein VII40_12320 [Xanthobacteraceae bacterium]
MTGRTARSLASAAVLCLAAWPPAAAADKLATVASCSGQGALPVAFAIDCVNVADAKLERCRRFIENEACRVFPAYRRITGISLEARCPKIKFTIYDRERWPAGGEAGGRALKCAIEYLADYSIDVKSPPALGPYDTHEILHEYQEELGALPYAHILFAPSQAQAMREIGDMDGYNRAISQMREALATFESRFAKFSPGIVADKCVLAELQTEGTLYLENDRNVEQFYRKLVRGSARDQADREARFNRMYDAVSGGRSRPFLLAHGCAPF